MKSLKFLNFYKIDKNIIDEFINSKWLLIVSDYQSNKTDFVRSLLKILYDQDSLYTLTQLYKKDTSIFIDLPFSAKSFVLQVGDG